MKYFILTVKEFKLTCISQIHALSDFHQTHLHSQSSHHVCDFRMQAA